MLLLLFIATEYNNGTARIEIIATTARVSSKVEDMSNLFYGCESLKEIDLSTIALGSNRTFGEYMQNDTSLTHIIFGDTIDGDLPQGNFSISEGYVDTTIEFKAGTSEATMRKVANYNWTADRRFVFKPRYTSPSIPLL